MPEGEVVRLRTARGGSIVAAFIPFKPDFPAKPAKPAQPSAYSLVATPFPEAASSSEDASSRPTILMSHGTAVDLGRLLPFYRSCQPSMHVYPILPGRSLHAHNSDALPGALCLHTDMHTLGLSVWHALEVNLHQHNVCPLAARSRRT